MTLVAIAGELYKVMGVLGVKSAAAAAAVIDKTAGSRALLAFIITFFFNPISACTLGAVYLGATSRLDGAVAKSLNRTTKQENMIFPSNGSFWAYFSVF